MDKIRKKLLEETNYRCGYCMRNITPRAYYLNDNPNPIHDYEIYNYEERKFYNISDRAHIAPNAEVADGFKDFYNLIVLCKICHHEVDKAGILGVDDQRIKQLRKLKLHWMVASGKFTSLELDCIMNLYNAQNSGSCDKRWIYTETLDFEDKTSAPPSKFNYNKLLIETSKNPDLKVSRIVIQQINCHLFDRLEKAGFIFYEKLPPGVMIGTTEEHGKYNITDLGNNFCAKFFDAYKDDL